MYYISNIWFTQDEIKTLAKELSNEPVDLQHSINWHLHFAALQQVSMEQDILVQYILYNCLKNSPSLTNPASTRAIPTHSQFFNWNN